MERIAQLITIKDNNSPVVFKRFQNYDTKPLIEGGQRFEYLPFLYQGATRNKAGDNMESALFMSVNQLVTSVIAEYVEERRACIVQTYRMGVCLTATRVLIRHCKLIVADGVNVV